MTPAKVEQEHLPCPFCGRLVIIDKPAKRVYHEMPACKRYLRELKAIGLKHRGHVVLDPPKRKRR